MSSWKEKSIIRQETYRKALEKYYKGSNNEENFRAYFGLAKVYAALAEKSQEEWMYRESLKYLMKVSSFI